MKKKLLTILGCMVLMMVLLSLSVSAAYTLTAVNKKDTVSTFYLTDVATEKRVPFSYKIPKDGAAVLYFYKTSCPNSQAGLCALNNAAWARNERINIYAVESTKEHGIDDILAFQQDYTSNITDAITWLDSPSANLAFSYLSAAGDPYNSLTFPVVMIITADKGVNTIRYYDHAVTDARLVGNSLEKLLNVDLNIPDPVPLTLTVEQDFDRAAEFMKLLNAYRRERGLSTLNPNQVLSEITMLRAAELTMYPYEYRPDDTTIYDMITERIPETQIAHGIVKGGYDAPDELLQDVLANNMDGFYLGYEDFTQIGVGCVTASGITYWAVLLTDNFSDSTTATQTGRETKAFTVNTYIENLDNPGLAPKDTTIYMGDSATVWVQADKEWPFAPITPVSISAEVLDIDSGKPIATASIQPDGSILVTGTALGFGILEAWAWEGQETPYTTTIAVTDDPNHRYCLLETFVSGSGQLSLSLDRSPSNNYIVVTAQPDEGWKVHKVLVEASNGSIINCHEDGENQYGFTMPPYDVTVTAVFVPEDFHEATYTIIKDVTGYGELYLSEENAAVTANTPVTISGRAYLEGELLKHITVTDADDNSIPVTDNGDGSYTFIMPASDVTVSVIFAPSAGYAITLYDSYHGTANCSHETADPYEVITVTITPDEGYEFKDMSILWDVGEYEWIDEHTFTFIMPAGEVEIYIYFTETIPTEGDFGDGLHWSLENGVLTISGSGSMGEIDVYFHQPWYDRAAEIEQVVIQEGVTNISTHAFSYLKNLTAVSIPASVEHIDIWAFLGCKQLTRITFAAVPARGIENVAFADVSADVSVPANDRSWTDEVTQDYDGDLTWNHSWSSEVTEPTCTEDGYTTWTCICGDTAKDDFTDALGHKYTNGVCSRCGETDPNHKEPITNPFTDVADTDWFYNPVLWAVENKVTGGMTETTFGPNVNCTRAQVVTFLYAAAGKPEVKTDSEPFEDVSEADWFYKPVLWAVENGITGGTSPTTFGPNEECTRAQVVTFLYAAAGKPAVTAGSDFDDVADTDWYAKPVIWAKANNITGGISPTAFGPNNICTRAQVVTFLYKADQIQ